MDNTKFSIEEPVTRSPGSPFNLLPILLMITFALLTGLLGYWLGTRQAGGPGENAPEVGFARDMMIHHAQAVDMATLLRDRSEDPVMRQIALDMVLTQQAQIGQMRGWLSAWQYPIASTDPAMAWMGSPTTDLMPGMATPEELNHLRDLQGTAADGEFLRLMILHHRAGVHMAEAILAQSDRPEVRSLAQSIVDAQTSEVTVMQELLAQKGFPAVPEEESAEHGEMPTEDMPADH